MKLTPRGATLDPHWSRPAWGGWIEIFKSFFDFDTAWSRPARGGWIEIAYFVILNDMAAVPPRTGRVD